MRLRMQAPKQRFPQKSPGQTRRNLEHGVGRSERAADRQRLLILPLRIPLLARACKKIRQSRSVSRCRWLWPDGSQEQPYRNSNGNFEEPMDSDHDHCRFGVRYKHDDC
jgi:hypothetical protein